MKNLKNKKVLSENIARELYFEEFATPGKVSDIIIPVSNDREKDIGVYNLMSGERGCDVEDVIREGHPFVYVERGSINNTGILPECLKGYAGVYAVKSSIADVLTVIFYRLVSNGDGTYRWEEAETDSNRFGKARCFFSQDFTIHGNTIPDNMFHDYPALIDIFGQSKAPDYKSCSSASFKEVVYGYFGGVPMYESDMGIIIPSDIGRIIKCHIEYSEKGEYVGIFNSGSGYLSALPKEAEGAFIRFMMKQHIPECLVSYLQDTKEGFVQRDFLPVVHTAYPLEGTTFQFYEVRRTLMTPKDYNHNGRFLSYDDNLIVLWYDGIGSKESKKPFPGAAQNILDFVISAADSDEPCGKWGRELVETVGLMPSNIAKMLCIMLSSDLDRIVLGADLSLDSSIHLFRMFLSSRGGTKYRLMDIFGTINECGQTIDEVLNIPEGMADVALIPRKSLFKDNDSVIKDCKKVFESFFDKKKATEYFMGMKENDYKKLLELVYKCGLLSLNKKCEMLRDSNCLNNWKIFLA